MAAPRSLSDQICLLNGMPVKIPEEDEDFVYGEIIDLRDRCLKFLKKLLADNARLTRAYILEYEIRDCAQRLESFAFIRSVSIAHYRFELIHHLFRISFETRNERQFIPSNPYVKAPYTGNMDVEFPTKIIISNLSFVDFIKDSVTFLRGKIPNSQSSSQESNSQDTISQSSHFTTPSISQNNNCNNMQRYADILGISIKDIAILNDFVLFHTSDTKEKDSMNVPDLEANSSESLPVNVNENLVQDCIIVCSPDKTATSSSQLISLEVLPALRRKAYKKKKGAKRNIKSRTSITDYLKRNRSKAVGTRKPKVCLSKKYSDSDVKDNSCNTKTDIVATVPAERNATVDIDTQLSDVVGLISSFAVATTSVELNQNTDNVLGFTSKADGFLPIFAPIDEVPSLAISTNSVERNEPIVDISTENEQLSGLSGLLGFTSAVDGFQPIFDIYVEFYFSGSLDRLDFRGFAKDNANLNHLSCELEQLEAANLTSEPTVAETKLIPNLTNNGDVLVDLLDKLEYSVSPQSYTNEVKNDNNTDQNANNGSFKSDETKTQDNIKLTSSETELNMENNEANTEQESADSNDLLTCQEVITSLLGDIEIPISQSYTNEVKNTDQNANNDSLKSDETKTQDNIKLASLETELKLEDNEANTEQESVDSNDLLTCQEVITTLLDDIKIPILFDTVIQHNYPQDNQLVDPSLPIVISKTDVDSTKNDFEEISNNIAQNNDKQLIDSNVQEDPIRYENAQIENTTTTPDLDVNQVSTNEESTGNDNLDEVFTELPQENLVNTLNANNITKDLVLIDGNSKNTSVELSPLYSPDEESQVNSSLPNENIPEIDNQKSELPVDSTVFENDTDLDVGVCIDTQWQIIDSANNEVNTNTKTSDYKTTEDLNDIKHESAVQDNCNKINDDEENNQALDKSIASPFAQKSSSLGSNISPQHSPVADIPDITVQDLNQAQENINNNKSANKQESKHDEENLFIESSDYKTTSSMEDPNNMKYESNVQDNCNDDEENNQALDKSIASAFTQKSFSSDSSISPQFLPLSTKDCSPVQLQKQVDVPATIDIGNTEDNTNIIQPKSELNVGNHEPDDLIKNNNEDIDLTTSSNGEQNNEQVLEAPITLSSSQDSTSTDSSISPAYSPLSVKGCSPVQLEIDSSSIIDNGNIIFSSTPEQNHNITDKINIDALEDNLQQDVVLTDSNISSNLQTDLIVPCLKTNTDNEINFQIINENSIASTENAVNNVKPISKLDDTSENDQFNLSNIELSDVPGLAHNTICCTKPDCACSLFARLMSTNELDEFDIDLINDLSNTALELVSSDVPLNHPENDENTNQISDAQVLINETLCGSNENDVLERNLSKSDVVNDQKNQGDNAKPSEINREVSESDSVTENKDSNKQLIKHAELSESSSDQHELKTTSNEFKNPKHESDSSDTTSSDSSDSESSGTESSSSSSSDETTVRENLEQTHEQPILDSSEIKDILISIIEKVEEKSKQNDIIEIEFSNNQQNLQKNTEDSSIKFTCDQSDTSESISKLSNRDEKENKKQISVNAGYSQNDYSDENMYGYLNATKRFFDIKPLGFHVIKNDPFLSNYHQVNARYASHLSTRNVVHEKIILPDDDCKPENLIQPQLFEGRMETNNNIKCEINTRKSNDKLISNKNVRILKPVVPIKICSNNKQSSQTITKTIKKKPNLKFVNIVKPGVPIKTYSNNNTTKQPLLKSILRKPACQGVNFNKSDKSIRTYTNKKSNLKPIASQTDTNILNITRPTAPVCANVEKDKLQLNENVANLEYSSSDKNSKQSITTSTSSELNYVNLSALGKEDNQRSTSGSEKQNANKEAKDLDANCGVLHLHEDLALSSESSDELSPVYSPVRGNSPVINNDHHDSADTKTRMEPIVASNNNTAKPKEFSISQYLDSTPQEIQLLFPVPFNSTNTESCVDICGPNSDNTVKRIVPFPSLSTTDASTVQQVTELIKSNNLDLGFTSEELVELANNSEDKFAENPFPTQSNADMPGITVQELNKALENLNNNKTNKQGSKHDEELSSRSRNSDSSCFSPCFSPLISLGGSPPSCNVDNKEKVANNIANSEDHLPDNTDDYQTSFESFGKALGLMKKPQEECLPAEINSVKNTAQNKKSPEYFQHDHCYLDKLGGNDDQTNTEDASSQDDANISIHLQGVILDSPPLTSTSSVRQIGVLSEEEYQKVVYSSPAKTVEISKNGEVLSQFDNDLDAGTSSSQDSIDSILNEFLIFPNKKYKSKPKNTPVPCTEEGTSNTAELTPLEIPETKDDNDGKAETIIPAKPGPKKRGRKPKIKPEGSENDAAVDKPPPKKRGRKPKPKPEGENIDAPKPQPKKRGRKPRPKTDDDTDDEARPPPKKRGRKPGPRPAEGARQELVVCEPFFDIPSDEEYLVVVGDVE